MDSQLVKKTQKLTKAEDMRNQTKLVMQHFANWWHYLSPAPLSIAFLGELVFISSSTDFSINKNPPKHGYRFIKYPESFWACLMQVCNSGWQAFNEAHKNMDKIRLHTLHVSDYMKKAVNILFQGNDEVVNALLPDSLKNIRTIAHDCHNLAKETEKRFTDVINIIQELLEACINAKHFYGEELEEIKKKLEENKMRKAAAEKAAKDSEKIFRTMEKDQKELTEILISMRNCEEKEIDFNTTIKMLGKVMNAMERVEEQWKKMRFYRMVSHIVETSLSNTLKDFVNTSEKTKKLFYDGKIFNKNMLYNQAFQASNIASLVHMISSTYTEVSDKYLMDRVSPLGKLMAMDRNKSEFLQERQQLRDKCDEAERAVLQLVQKNREEFERKTDKRLEKIDKELLAVLPPAAP